MKNDDLGDRMKAYESQTTAQKLIPLLPAVARLDGKAFSKFTKGLRRPYDERLSKLMVETTKFLVDTFNFNIGYTQSDEITLIYYNDNPKTKMDFNGKVFKLESTLAAYASVFFDKNLQSYLPEKKDKFPTFDCRVFNVPTLDEAVNAVYWRELDATKNSISMASQHFYSAKELMNRNGKDKQEMLFQKGINWNDYPSFFKRGTYVQRKKMLTKFSAEELSRLPEKHQARQNPNLEIERSVVRELDVPPLSKIKNKIDFILFGADPI